MEQNARTYVAMILDRSGSMARIREQAVNGFNEQIQALQDDNFKLGETWVSFFTFNSKWEEKYFNQRVVNVKELKDSDYDPRGNTHLWETSLHVIEKLETATDPKSDLNAYLVVIISDGQDTSNNLASQRRLAEKIRELQETGKWTFTYLGANQNLFRVQQSLGIPAGNMAGFSASREGAYKGMHTNSVQLRSYAAKRAGGQTAVLDFYDVGDKIADLTEKTEPAKPALKGNVDLSKWVHPMNRKPSSDGGKQGV